MVENFIGELLPQISGRKHKPDTEKEKINL